MANVKLKVNPGQGKHHVAVEVDGIETRFTYVAGETFEGPEKLLTDFPGKFSRSEDPVTTKELNAEEAAIVANRKAEKSPTPNANVTAGNKSKT